MSEESEKTIQASPLDQVIEESTAKIQAEKPVGVKRPRGRPRKYPKPEESGPAPAAQAEPAQPQSDLTPFIAGGFKMIGAGIAHRLDCPEVALTDDEATPLAQQADAIIREYCPDLERSKHGKLAVFGFSLIALAGTKAYIYYTKKLEREKQKPEPKPETASNPFVQPFPVITAN